MVILKHEQHRYIKWKTVECRSATKSYKFFSYLDHDNFAQSNLLLINASTILITMFFTIYF